MVKSGLISGRTCCVYVLLVEAEMLKVERVMHLRRVARMMNLKPIRPGISTPLPLILNDPPVAFKPERLHNCSGHQSVNLKPFG